ncbi:MAG: DNA-processing protein DprA, partial [Hydrotalea sp.]|nr:DNA-processing protein DprA [Hydrotalea sp.]
MGEVSIREKNNLAWLRLARCPTIGPVAFRKLLRRYHTAEKTLEALPEMAKKFPRTRPIIIPPLEKIEKEWNDLEKLGGKFLFLFEKNYPALLTNTDDAPPVLSVLGHDHLLHQDGFAIVGAREASLAGEKLAKRFSEVMAQKGYVLISGMARGIDTAVHKGAMKTGTVAVLAGGVDNIYPRENEKLYHELTALGCIISEAPLGGAPMAKNFPKRNRIISGLSLGLLVIEAALKSGTLITARYALEQGRELFAVPGSPLDQRMRGCNQLIKNGAHITETPDDILPLLEESTLRVKKDITGNGNGVAEGDHLFATDASEAVEDYSVDDIDKAKRMIRKNLSPTPTNLDELLAQWPMPRGLFYQALLEMELMGEVEHVQGNNYAMSITIDNN